MRAGDFCVGAVVVAEAVGGGGVLGVEFELGEEGWGYRCGCVSEGAGEDGIGASGCTSAFDFDRSCGDRVNCTEE